MTSPTRTTQIVSLGNRGLNILAHWTSHPTFRAGCAEVGRRGGVVLAGARMGAEVDIAFGVEWDGNLGFMELIYDSGRASFSAGEEAWRSLVGVIRRA